MPSPLGSPTSSRSVTQTVNGSHRFTIKGYSLAKGMGVGKHIASESFTVGGYQWAIYFYPDGKNPEDHSTYVSVFVALASEGTDVRALFELTLLDQSGKGKHKVHSHFDRALESGPYTLKYRGSMWGYKRFFRRAMLETSDFLKDDCLKINCTVGVVVSETDCPRLHSIQVPESDIGSHFGILLENEEGSDITFNVFGEKFHAHKLVLAARSPVFEAEFSDRMEDDNEIVVTDMEPKVFKALLHFIYRDSLIDDEEFVGTSSSSMPSVSDALAAKLLAAADKYDLPRLRLMCESVLCKDISVNSVANILALADRHHAMDLKSVCLKFAAENLVGSYFVFLVLAVYGPRLRAACWSYLFEVRLLRCFSSLSQPVPAHGSAVMRSDGFEYLKENCPTLQSELLKTVAGCEEEFSGGGKSRSVWAHLSDGGDTINRSVRQQTWENGGEQNQGMWVQLDGGGDGEGSPRREE
ncbi:BTB/POZ and MATH domain-containing 4 -like protein [Gossypium arboreum]|uniref:BTB/POZ and MATH domain-containing 4-like protein n=1 Tax=Gossypium arboreum TaxID=29729 RepID=A0A0B0PP32_GOSAR|nr:BTB/POZ and MATH domain-containing 4 -like protein [Gossypium arboreum]